jgi:transcriptional regulator with XRE-family HTH domain
VTNRQLPPAVGQRLKQVLSERSMTQREMAARLGITDAHMSSIILGKETPGLALAVRIEDETGIPARDFARVA